VFLRHLVLVILCGWLSGMQGAPSYSVRMTLWYAEGTPCVPDCRPHRITSTKCRTNTVSPDDGLIVARNM
jgi:hypothetical protein